MAKLLEPVFDFEVIRRPRSETLTRLSILEEPAKLRALGRKYFITLGGLAGAGFALYKFWDVFEGLF